MSPARSRKKRRAVAKHKARKTKIRKTRVRTPAAETPRPEKVQFGIPGLDKLVDNGVPLGSVLLVSGCVGSGKTVFSLQFLAEGAMKFGERGLFISFEEYDHKIRAQADKFGWNFSELERKGLIKVITVSTLTLGEVLSDIDKAIASFKPQRLVIDSFTFITLFAQTRTRLVALDRLLVDEALYEAPRPQSPSTSMNVLVVKKVVTDLILKLQTRGITSLLTSEISKNSDWYSRDTVSEFACDGVFMLKLTSIGGNAQRTIELVKLRNSPIRCGIFNFDIAQNGITVRS
jgi:circadian clock protein KaiC